MHKVKALLDMGLTIPNAIKQALGIPLREVAENSGIAAPIMSDVINGNRRATEQQVDALISQLGGTREEWQELLWAAGVPGHIPWRDALQWLADRPDPSVRASA